MKFYLSSYRLGNDINKLINLMPLNKKLAYIANALDFSQDIKRREASEKKDISQLNKVGFKVERFDLRKYFYKPTKLEKDISLYGSIWVRGGNVFMLRQAMLLSGLDKLLQKLAKQKSDLLYGGYSAGICILGPTLKGLEIVDILQYEPYFKNLPLIWSGLNIIDYVIVPHYQSNHPESAKIEKVVQFYRKNNIPFKTLKDGEVIIISQN